MTNIMRFAITLALLAAITTGCKGPAETGGFSQEPEALLAGEVMAVAYSGFREGQHPDRGDGAANPSDEQILEDLQILADHDFALIRLYDSDENSARTLELIQEHEFRIKVLLGIWLRAEFSNHEMCRWLDEPIPEEQLAANTIDNAAEVQRGIELARRFSDVVVAVNVGNEALVEWNDHMVPLDNVIEYVRQVKAAMDFLGIHTYAAWEEKTIDEALPYTIENMEGVRAALPGKPMAILEAGWATTAIEFGGRASEAKQARYFTELRDWAAATNTTVFFFEAFDEPWKGDPANPRGAEKHWGLFFVDRSPKQVMKR
jgi:exo-beta-1,3-glucanase (GH17 family)